MKPKYVFIGILVSLVLLAGLYNMTNQSKNIEKVTFLEMEKLVANVEKKEAAKEKTEKKTAEKTANGMEPMIEIPYVFEETGKVKLITEKKVYEANLDHRESSGFDKKYNVTYRYQHQESFFSTFIKFLIIGMAIYFVFSLIKNKDHGMNKVGNVNKKSKDDKNKDTHKSIMLKDVGGLGKETKEQLETLIQMVKNKENANGLGVEPDKGYLFYGPPGTGKTLTAQAIANELGIYFVSASGSEFVEMFVGVGASRVRELFKKARDNAPSLIFIDEIDTIAKQRGNHPGSNDESDRTLTQFLTEMDGIDKDEDIIVIGATNRMDTMDSAILRDGRFDYKIYMGLPDLQGRKEIVAIHSKGKKLSKEMLDKLDRVAEMTTGFSGAEIKGLFNKAARKAASQNKKEITMDEINDAYDVIILGNQGNALADGKVKERIAYHEAGHALIGVLNDRQSVRKVTIIPRGQAGGYVASIRKDFDLATRSEIINRISMTLAGGVAENLIYGEHSIGVSGDVQQAKQMIEIMVENGLQEKFTLTFGEKEKTEEMKLIYDEAYTKCVTLLQVHQGKLEKIKEALMKKETLDGEEVAAIVYDEPVPVSETVIEEEKQAENKLEEFAKEIKEKGKELAIKWLKKPKKTT